MSIALMMGEIIADLHIAFKKCGEADVFWNNSLLEEMNGWIKDNLEKGRWKYLKKEEYENTVSQLEQLYDKLPVQLIHRDVHFGNFDSVNDVCCAESAYKLFEFVKKHEGRILKESLG